MDKIQTAIAKARAERQNAVPANINAAKPVPAPAVVPDAPAPDAVENAWAALPEVELKSKRMARNRIVAFAGGRETTAVDMMRTRVLQQMRANDWKRVAITSPTPACGKSTIALNLAFSIARQADLKAVLMEMDLRRPSIAGTLGIENDINSADVISGKARFEDNVVRPLPNLAISSNTGPARNPAEILGGLGVGETLKDIDDRYQPDFTIFDMPPMLATDDTMAFAPHVDCVILVSAAETTTIKEVDLCERDLAAQTNVLGVILNKCRYMGPEYGYGYYGGY